MADTGGTDASGNAQPKWVWFSTRDSINNDILSVTAILETIIAVPVYWWIAIHFATYLPLLVSAAVAPLVLLRSDQSVALGVKLFTMWENIWKDNRNYRDLRPSERRNVLVGAMLSAMVSGVLCYLICGIVVKDHSFGMLEPALFVGGELISIVAVGAIVPKVAATLTIVVITMVVAITSIANVSPMAIVITLPVAALGGLTIAAARLGTVTRAQAVAAAGNTLAAVIVMTAASMMVLGILYQFGGDTTWPPPWPDLISRSLVIGLILGLIPLVTRRQVSAGVVAAITGVLGVALAVLGIWQEPYPVTGTLPVVILFVGTLIFLLLLFGTMLGVLIVGVSVRITATVVHIYPGLQVLPRNFRRLILCTSPMQEPELVPGLQKGQTDFTLSDLLRLLQGDIRRGDISDKIFSLTFYALAVVIWFLPAWLYRITLKSTAWFWWPLAYLGGDLRRAKDPDRLHWWVRQSLWAKTSLALALVTFAAFFLANVPPARVLIDGNPLLSPVGYILLIRWSSLQPWQVLSITLAAIGLSVIYWADVLGRDYHEAAIRRDGKSLTLVEQRFGLIERLVRLRLILTVVFWLVVGAHALLHFNSVKCWFTLPVATERWAQWIYADRYPEMQCSGRD